MISYYIIIIVYAKPSEIVSDILMGTELFNTENLKTEPWVIKGTRDLVPITFPTGKCTQGEFLWINVSSCIFLKKHLISPRNYSAGTYFRIQ